ncbi:PorT protein [Neptunitalea chrysea]|uniref:PorT protein n=1 Tax=Neptunitalea chrysea TaxID=1647581 RepID=A0A9W6EU55_9FLAO|nr:porin family protein [Neptunitalea chrysea]GLB52174.1 PorT protein [Neptunitalea chrysea]
MKRNLLIIILLGCITTSFAQRNRTHRVVEQLPDFDNQAVHWGYYLGFNKYDFLFNYNQTPEGGGETLVDAGMGFNVGLIGNLRLSDYLDLRLEPGLYYTKRTLNYQDPALLGDDAIRETNSSYIHVPLLLKASAKRWGNVKPYLVGGFSTSLNLGSKENSIDDNSAGVFRMKKNTYYYEIGFGIDFYTPTFKFSPSIRGVFALNNEMVKDIDPDSPWTGNINTMKTRGVFINFTFE